MARSYEQYRREWSSRHEGVGPAGGLVAGWLRVSYGCAVPFVRLRVPADLVTLLGLALAIGAAGASVVGGRAWVLAAVLVGLSGLADGVDGAVAALTGRGGAWGAFLDSVVDRLSDAALLLALWWAGATGWICVAAAVAVVTLEYGRARAAAVGAGALPVTVGERPARLAVTGMFLLAAGIYPQSAAGWATTAAALVALLAGAGAVTLVVAVRRRS